MPPIYFDYNATAPLRPEARTAWLAVTQATWANPASVHREGQAAQQALETARRDLAARLQCGPGELIFTSGATEAANQVLRALLADRGHAVVAAMEHHAVLEPAQALERRRPGAVTCVAAQVDGRTNPARLLAALRPDSRLIALMAVNNETGVIQEISALATGLRAWNAQHRAGGEAVGLLCDLTQALGKLDPAPFAAADWALFSGHKFGAPKGIGGLIARRPLAPASYGGNAEHGQRPGTVPVELVAAQTAAFVAAEQARAADTPRITALRDRLEQGLIAACPGAVVAGRAAPRVSNTSFVCFPGQRTETLVMKFDLAGVCVSTGAACVQGAQQTSHVLAAMGLPAEQIAGAVRFSLGPGNSAAEVDQAVAIAKQITSR